MENLKLKIERAMMRANLAYKLYSEDKKYFQAKRIYKSNLELYKLLEELIYNEKVKNLEPVFMFLFHLDDWFEQFKEKEIILSENINLETIFVFNRMNKSPKFPTDFLDKI